MSILGQRLNESKTENNLSKLSVDQKSSYLTELSVVPKKEIPTFETPKSVLGARLFEQKQKRAALPTYYQQYKKVNEVVPQPVTFGTKTDFTIKQGIEEILNKKSDPEVAKKLTGIWGGNNPITKFLIGRGTDPEDLGRDRGYFTEKIPERGLLGFLTGDLLKSDHETAAELYEVFLDSGMNPDEAFQKANDSVIEGKPIGLDPQYQQAYLTWDKWEKIGTVIDVTFLGADILSFGGSTALKAGVKATSRSAMSEALKTASQSGSRTAIRDVLIKQYPNIKGSEQLEQAIDLIEKTPDNFSWLQIRNEFRNSALFKELAESSAPTPIKTTTEAQKSLFRTGTPNLQTVTGGVDNVIEARRSITSVLRGEQEASRLSNPDVFLSEIKAGALPRNITTDDTVEVFRIGGSGRRAKVGEQVTLSKELAGEGAQSFKVPLRDLVRLPDGTFARVPVEQIGKDLTPSINAVRDVVTREKVIAREQAEKVRLQMEEIARKNAKEKAEREATEQARQAEAVRLAEAEKLAKAREVVDSAKVVTKGMLSKLKTQADKVANSIQKTENKIVKANQTRTALLRASTQKAGLTAGRFVQKFGDYMTVTEKNKVKAGKSLTTAERTRIQKRVRDAFDKEISALKATKDELQIAWRQAASELSKSKSLLKDADEAKKVLAESDEAVKAQKKASLEQKAIAQAEKAKTISSNATEEFTNIIKENYSVTRKEAENIVDNVPASGGTKPFISEPLTGQGTEVANQIAKGILKETDEAYRTVGIEGGLEAVKNGTAKLNAETLEKISMVHRVATNEQQLKNAIVRVMKDPQKAYIDFINSNAMDDSMAALYSALIRSDFVLKDANRLNNLVRHFDKFGTRVGQELQAFQMIGRLDYPSLISKMMRKGDDIMKKRGINVNAEVAKIEKALGDEFDKLVAISKTEALEQLTKITCDV